MNQKLEKLWRRQDRRSQKPRQNKASTIRQIKLLSYEPKHIIEDKSNETHFLSDINGENLCEIEASIKWYTKKLRDIPVDRGLSRLAKCFKDNELLAVAFDKGSGFCVYQFKMNKIVYCPIFLMIETTNAKTFLKREEKTNGNLLEMKKQDLVTDKFIKTKRPVPNQRNCRGAQKLKKITRQRALFYLFLEVFITFLLILLLHFLERCQEPSWKLRAS